MIVSVLRAFLVLLSLLAAIPPSLGAMMPTGGGHDSDCCCCVEPEQCELPALQEEPCGCGCVAPKRTPEAPAPEERDRSLERDLTPQCIAADPAFLAVAAPIEAPRLKHSPAPLRAPPPPSVLCVWME